MLQELFSLHLETDKITKGYPILLYKIVIQVQTHTLSQAGRGWQTHTP